MLRKQSDSHLAKGPGFSFGRAKGRQSAMVVINSEIMKHGDLNLPAIDDAEESDRASPMHKTRTFIPKRKIYDDSPLTEDKMF